MSLNLAHPRNGSGDWSIESGQAGGAPIRSHERLNPIDSGRLGLIALAALLLPAVLFIAGIASYLVWDAGQRAERDTIARAHRIVERVDTEIQREIRALNAVATSLTNVAITRPHPTPDRVRLNAELFPEWLGSLVWAHGETTSRFSSLPVEGLPAIPPSWSTPELLGSAPVIGGIEEVAGRHVVLVHQAVPEDPRRLILTTALHPTQFHATLMAHMPEDSIGALVDREGDFIARSRDHDQRLGTQSTIYVRTAIAEGAAEGVYRGRTLEGFENVSAFVRSPLSGWSVHIAISQALVDEPLRLALVVALAGGALSIALAGGLIWLLLRDIRRRQDAQLALAHAQRVEALGRLTGGIAHDFNNLLTVIIGNIERSRRSGADDADRSRLLEGALGAARSAGGLTRSLLAYSRKQHLAPEVVEANDCVKEAVDVIGRTLGDRYEVVTALDADAGAIMVDRAQFVSAIVNLAINARDAMEDGGRITLKSHRSDLKEAERRLGLPAGRYVAIVVSDTGPGMSQDVAARAFEPFFTTKDVGKGTGLGLAQVEGFTRQSGGAAQLTTAEGAGVTITLYFPAVDKVDLPPASGSVLDAPPAQVSLQKHLRVLLVEDDPGVRDHARHLLKDAGFHVTECATTEQAEAHLRTKQFDLLFSDVILPGSMTGADLADLAEQIQPGIEVLLATGYSGKGFAALEGKRRILAKPYDAKALADALLRVNARPAALPPTILLVEDEPFIMLSSAEVLAEAGYQVVEASTLSAARKALERRDTKVSLAIIDLGLPDGSGQSLVDDLRNRGDIKVLVASGTRPEGYEAALLLKPYTPDQLLTAVQAAVRE